MLLVCRQDAQCKSMCKVLTQIPFYGSLKNYRCAFNPGTRVYCQKSGGRGLEGLVPWKAMYCTLALYFTGSPVFMETSRQDQKVGNTENYIY